MDLTSKKDLKELLDKYSSKPNKGLGQCFLVNKKTFEEIIKAADLNQNDIVLEIGPGIGNLTSELAKRVKKVAAIEKDLKMCEILKETLKEFKNIEIINEDILKLDIKRYLAENYKIIANLPYYLTSPAIRKFLESENPPESMVLMIQKEVAQRIIAKPPKMSILAVSVQFYSIPKIINYVPKKYFWPSPKVDSAIIKLAVNKKQSAVNKKLFFQIVKAGFSQPRKQLLNNFSKILKLDKPAEISKSKNLAGREEIIFWLLENKIEPAQRAETLSVENWINLTKTFDITCHTNK